MLSNRLGHLSAVLLTLGVLLLSATDTAASPCEGLADEDPEVFEELRGHLERASNRSEAADYDAAADAYVEALKLCDDFVIQYNVARMYQQAGQCRKSKTWFENVVRRLEDETNDPRADRIVGLSRNYLTELEDQCPETASIRVRCAQPGVRVSVDGGEPRDCPASWEVKPGSHVVKARKDGFEDVIEQFSASKGRDRTIDIEALEATEPEPEVAPEASEDEPEEPEIPQMGTLVVRCRGDLDGVRVLGESIDRQTACGETLSLLPGPYRVRAEGQLRKADVAAGVQSEVELGRATQAQSTEEVASAQNGLVFGLRASSGVAMVRGELYDRNNAAFDRPLRLDGLQPSLPHLALVGEVGWRFGRRVSALVRPRVDVVNPSYAVLGIARFHFMNTGAIGLHVDIGGGYGQLLSPVQPVNDDDIYLDRSGSFQAVTGIGLSWRLSSSFAAVIQASANIGLPEFGAVFDIGSIGIEGTL